jgi:hypothetical protein
MSIQFTISDVSAEFMMDVAKLVASSPHSLTKKDIENSFNVSRVYISNAISQCIQLGLICVQDGNYISADKFREFLKRSEKSQLLIALRQALQSYPPYLLYLDFISKGYDSMQSSNMTCGIFRIQSSKEKVEKMFKKWGLQTSIIVDNGSGKLSIPEAAKGLSVEYVDSLIKAMKADLQAKIFLIETMSQQAYAYLTQKGINIEDLSDALMNYEKDSQTSAFKACQTFEYFLYKLGEDVGADVKTCNGLIELADKIKSTTSNKVMLKNQWHICHGIGGLRNMTHHSPEKETGKEWNFTPQGAIVSSLIVPTAIRSIYLYWNEKKQEF